MNTPEEIIKAVGSHEAQLAEINKERSEWKSHYEKLKADGTDHGKALEDVRTMIDRAIKRLDSAEAALSKGAVLPGSGNDNLKTLGQILVEQKGLAEMANSNVKGSFAVKFKGFFLNPEFKTTIDSSAVGSSTPGILVPQRVPGIVKPGVRRVRVRDLIPRFPTTNNAIEYVKENAFTNAASPTAETISKPESALTFTIESRNVRTVAHWIPAAKQVLADFVQLQSYVDQRLIEGLKDIEDFELLYGNNSGQHLAGFASDAGSYDTSRNLSGDTKIDKVNHYISQIEDANLVASGLVMKPSDWRAIELIKEEPSTANTGAYLLGGPRGTSEPMLWGLPVGTSLAVQAGKLFCGAFNSHTALWDREEAQVIVSTEHFDFFVRNMIAILAEERLVLTTYRNDAVIYGSF